jgi:O-acetyl-ADP-ribose deacetylase (regulator of RNase III)
MIEIKKGNIFTTKCHTIVNTVNCVGVMGTGIAYEFKLRFPEMFDKYKSFCDSGLIDIGNLWIYKLTKDDNEMYKNILNFPTKKHWKYPSKEEYLEKGLQKFIDTYKEKGILSIAFPLLGASKGGIDEEVSINIMEKYLDKVDIDVEIWKFDPNAKDDLYEDFKEKFLNLDDTLIKEQSKLRIDLIRKIKFALIREDINSMSGLLRVKGIGDVSLEKSFRFIKGFDKNNITLLSSQNS